MPGMGLPHAIHGRSSSQVAKLLAHADTYISSCHTATHPRSFPNQWLPLGLPDGISNPFLPEGSSPNSSYHTVPCRENPLPNPLEHLLRQDFCPSCRRACCGTVEETPHASLNDIGCCLRPKDMQHALAESKRSRDGHLHLTM